MGILSDSDIQELADSMPPRWNQYHREDARVVLRHYRRYKKGALKAEETIEQTKSEQEERARTLRNIALRRGQKVFRDSLFRQFGGKCVITLTEDEATLEAAHIKAYSNQGSTSVANGLLLRSDIHTLFDLHLISIDPSSLTIFCGKKIRASQTYGRYHGTPSLLASIRKTKTDLVALRSHFEETKG
jgi:predicted restriction endonuclease